LRAGEVELREPGERLEMRQPGVAAGSSHEYKF
jgi:hypothetical protein